MNYKRGRCEKCLKRYTSKGEYLCNNCLYAKYAPVFSRQLVREGHGRHLPESVKQIMIVREGE